MLNIFDKVSLAATNNPKLGLFGGHHVLGLRSVKSAIVCSAHR